jgi:hypothetical protein
MITIEGNSSQSLLKEIFGLGVDYGDVVFILILANQDFPTHCLEYCWVFIQLQSIKAAIIFMFLNSWIQFMFLNSWIQQLARISLPWWFTPCTIHLVTLCKPQIIWYFSRIQSTPIHVYQNDVGPQNNVLHIKSPFGVVCNNNFLASFILQTPLNQFF